MIWRVMQRTWALTLEEAGEEQLILLEAEGHVGSLLVVLV